MIKYELPNYLDSKILDNAYPTQKSITDLILQQYENLIVELLRNILKREPVPEDAKDLNMIYIQGITDTHDVSWKGHKIGTIKQTTDFEKGRVGWQFYPCEINTKNSTYVRNYNKTKFKVDGKDVFPNDISFIDIPS